MLNLSKWNSVYAVNSTVTYRGPWSVVRLFPLTLNWTVSVNWNRPSSKNHFRWPRSGWAWPCYDFYLDWSLLCSRYHLVFKWSSTASYTTKEGYFLVFPPKSLFWKNSQDFYGDLGITKVTYGDLGMMELLNLWHDITAVQKNSNSNQA